MKRALVVDDTKNIRKLLTTCLEMNGFEVVTGENGLEAIKMLRAENLDLAFLDIKMPELSGTEVFRRIRSEGILTPVVIMTAFATVKNAVECTKLGAVAYLQKPFTAEKITHLLEEMNPQKLFRNELDKLIVESELLISEAKVEEALFKLKKALSFDPCNGRIYFLLGKIYELKGDYIIGKKFYMTAEEFGY